MANNKVKLLKSVYKYYAEGDHATLKGHTLFQEWVYEAKDGSLQTKNIVLNSTDLWYAGLDKINYFLNNSK